MIIQTSTGLRHISELNYTGDLERNKAVYFRDPDFEGLSEYFGVPKTIPEFTGVSRTYLKFSGCDD